ncbi:MAG: hypothetical protein GY951_07850 [Psychromonas sp.]|nr:hypothetical protein [Alteromonadales bacterium]MCP5077954.1 hypothetical protein [Psychromonas sp.]
MLNSPQNVNNEQAQLELIYVEFLQQIMKRPHSKLNMTVIKNYYSRHYQHIKAILAQTNKKSREQASSNTVSYLQKREASTAHLRSSEKKLDWLCDSPPNQYPIELTSTLLQVGVLQADINCKNLATLNQIILQGSYLYSGWLKHRLLINSKSQNSDKALSQALGE